MGAERREFEPEYRRCLRELAEEAARDGSEVVRVRAEFLAAELERHRELRAAVRDFCGRWRECVRCPFYVAPLDREHVEDCCPLLRYR